MNKKIVSLVIVIGLFGLASLISAQIRLTNPLGATNTFPLLLEKIIIAVTGIIGALSVLMLIFAGILFVISAGDPAKVTKARSALTFAIIGVTIALAASGLILLVKTIIGVT